MAVIGPPNPYSIGDNMMNGEDVLKRVIEEAHEKVHPGRALEWAAILTLILNLLEAFQNCPNANAAKSHIKRGSVLTTAVAWRQSRKAGYRGDALKFAQSITSIGKSLSEEELDAISQTGEELPRETPTPSPSGSYWPGVSSLLIPLMFVLFSVGTIQAESYWPSDNASYWSVEEPQTEQTVSEDNYWTNIPTTLDYSPKPDIKKEFKNPGELIYYFGSESCPYCPAMESLANSLYHQGYNVQNATTAKNGLRYELENRYAVESFPQFVIVDADSKRLKRRVVGSTDKYTLLELEPPHTHPQDHEHTSTALPYSANRWTWPGGTKASLVSHLQGGVHGFSTDELQGMTYEQLVSLHNGDHEARRGSTVKYFPKQSYPGNVQSSAQQATRQSTQYQRSNRRQRVVKGSCPTC